MQKIKILEIVSTEPEPILTSYLGRNCGAWTKGEKLFISLKQAITYFKAKIYLKSFLDHLANGELTIKEKSLDLDKLTTFEFAEIYFGNNNNL